MTTFLRSGSAFPETIADEDQLNQLLITPSPELVAFMADVHGDLAVLGAGGKMGVSLAGLAAAAVKAAGTRTRVMAVSRFSNPQVPDQLKAMGVETLSCDLLDGQAVRALPPAENVIFMAGRKFGTSEEQALTWAINTVVPGNVGQHYRNSRIVAFSTGCVYPLVEHASTDGCRENDPPEPVGEYAQSCLGRERVFEYFSRTHGTPTLLFRLNYSVEPRYGVLHDIAAHIQAGEPVDCRVPFFNAIWQGDANERALRCLDLCTTPAAILNVTGPETLSVVDVAQRLGVLLGREVQFTGEPARLAYLNDASLSMTHFGPPNVPIDRVLRWVADWVARGGRSLHLPTHFEVSDGTF